MISIPGYNIEEKLYDGARSRIYYCENTSGGPPAAIKVYKDNSLNIKRRKDQYKLMTKIRSDNVIKPLDFVINDNVPILIMEYFSGPHLMKILEERRIDLHEFLEIALHITRGLKDIHDLNIIHKDITLSNILWNSKTKELKIIDFGIATELSKEREELKNPDKLEGTLYFISPEQTGRISRIIDFRTDFYSLGVVFYKMLTSQYPFDYMDPMELVHAHIAREVVPPSTIDKTIPGVLSDIIMKLIEKMAENRYQSSDGLLADLLQCKEMLEQKGEVGLFYIGEHDVSRILNIPEKVYGREKEFKKLMTIFDKVSKGSKELILYRGKTGIGKTTLVNEITIPVIKKNGYFINGKFDKFKRDIPYLGIIQAVSALFRQFLTESREKLNVRIKDIKGALGNMGKIVSDVIPEIEILIGKQPAVPELPATEVQNRFNNIFRDLIRVLTKSEEPVVLFIDDLQWSDNASLDLLTLLLTDPEIKHFMLIGAYRDKEVKAGHPFLIMLEKLVAGGVEINEVEVLPLNTGDINQLLTDTLDCKSEEANILAELISEKTAGNPFFIKEFLKTLYTSEYIKFNNKWEWNPEKIKDAGITENVVELMADKISELPDKTLAVLKIGCCIGTVFSLDVLSSIYTRSIDDTFENLKPAINEGYIIKKGHSYKFAHDRILEAAYSLLTKEEQFQMHYEIGLNFLSSSKNLDNDLFNIVSQLNNAVTLLSDDELKKLIDLNIKAGKKAKASAAFAPSLNFFKNALHLLPGNTWDSDYKLTLDLYTEIGEAEYINIQFEKANHMYDIILKKAHTIHDKIRAYELKINQITVVEADFQKAINLGLEVLRELKVNVPGQPSEFLLSSELEKENESLLKQTIVELFDLPMLTDKNQMSIIRIFTTLIGPMYRVRPMMTPLVFAMMTNLTIENGLTIFAPYVFVAYGFNKIAAFGDAEAGYEYGKLALRLTDKLNAVVFGGKVYVIHYIMINHWKNRQRDDMEMLLEAYKRSLEGGDIDYSAASINYYCNYQIFIGNPLESIEYIFYKYSKIIHDTKVENTIISYNIWRQLTENLRKKIYDKPDFSGKYFDEDKHLKKLQKDNDYTVLSHYYAAATIQMYIYGDLKNSLKFVNICEQYILGSAGLMVLTQYYFIYILILFEAVGTADEEHKKQYWEKIREIKKNFEKWAADGPGNYKHKYLLIQAEEKGLNNGSFDEVIGLYDRAVSFAHENQFLHEEAITNELAARYCFSKGLNIVGKSIINDAYTCFKKWGAIGKVHNLEKQFSYLRQAGGTIENNESGLVTSGTSGTSGTSSLDISTIMKAANTISGEIQLENLLRKMMMIVIENAGAQKGYFIMENDRNQWLIEAEADVKKNFFTVLQSIPVNSKQSGKSYPVLPTAIINYVIRTCKIVVLEDASKEGQFINDEYIKSVNPKSILCVPLVNQGKLTGILYLENNVSVGAFIPSHVDILRTLSSQVAISIDNARMYKDLDELNKNLEQKVLERTKKLSATLQELQQTQDQLIESEKLAALGQLTAGISHEINTPLGAIRSCIENIDHVVVSAIPELPVFLKSLSDPIYKLFLELLNSGIAKKRSSAREDRKVKKKLKAGLVELGFEHSVRVVLKLLSLGIHDSLEHYLPILQSSLRDNILDMAYKLSAIKQNTDIILSATAKASKVAFALKNYSHFDHTGLKAKSDIKETIEAVLTLYQNKFKQGINIVRRYEDIPPVACYSDELNQVWTNIVHNALQAMDNKGTLTITLSRDSGSIFVSFKDTGNGISDEIKDKIFKPFFTTRSAGDGSGLGLSIAKTIIDKHNGKIEVNSSPGEDTVFTVILPEEL